VVNMKSTRLHGVISKKTAVLGSLKLPTLRSIYPTLEKPVCDVFKLRSNLHTRIICILIDPRLLKERT
jgi:hypothetical protein